MDCSVQLFWGVNQQVWFDKVLNLKEQQPQKVEKKKKSKKKKVTSSALVLENEIDNDREILLVSFACIVLTEKEKIGFFWR